MKNPLQYLVLFILVIFSVIGCGGNKTNKVLTASKPLFRDTIYDGAADPVVIKNRETGSWYMFYTNRRAILADSTNSVAWVHGTPIGIAESTDNGTSWKYKTNCVFPALEQDSSTFWAPEVIYHDGLYHMYLTVVPGIFDDWGHPRSIKHLTSNDLINWNLESTLSLNSDKVIDACVFQLENGSWRMCYNNERDKKSMYYADSKDLYNWTDKGKVSLIGGNRGEGPKVVKWKNQYIMVVDEWRGLGVYKSNDAVMWHRQKNRILETPGTGKEDGAKGQHPDVVISGEKAYIFYFVHPDLNKPDASPREKARSLIQVAELQYTDSLITCDREKDIYIQLK